MIRMIKNESSYLIFDKPKNLNLKYYVKKGYVSIQNIAYSLCFRLASKCTHMKEKQYYVSICAIFKNEGMYLKEWIEYHRLIGVQHFYLYNNNSSDNYLEVLSSYIKSGLVSLIDWPYDQAQMKAYKDCIEKYQGESNWIGFIDLDEFVVPIHNNSIVDFLVSFQNRSAVKIYWQVFGTSGLLDRDRDGLVIEDFTTCWRKHDEVGKCFYNTRFGFDPNWKYNKGLHHSFWGTWGHWHLPPVNCFGRICQRGYESVLTDDFPIQINHYFTKSYKEYIEKASKGDVFFENNPHNLDYFYRHEMLVGKSDFTIYKYLVKLKQNMIHE